MRYRAAELWTPCSARRPPCGPPRLRVDVRPRLRMLARYRAQRAGHGVNAAWDAVRARPTWASGRAHGCRRWRRPQRGCRTGRCMGRRADVAHGVRGHPPPCADAPGCQSHGCRIQRAGHRRADAARHVARGPGAVRGCPRGGAAGVAFSASDAARTSSGRVARACCTGTRHGRAARRRSRSARHGRAARTRCPYVLPVRAARTRRVDGLRGWAAWMGCVDGLRGWAAWMGCVDGLRGWAVDATPTGRADRVRKPPFRGRGTGRSPPKSST